MTSYTRKLYRNGQQAQAEAIRNAHVFERELVYGKAVTLACFTPASKGLVPAFGKRLPSGSHGCEQNCRHPACQSGCTLGARR